MYGPFYAATPHIDVTRFTQLDYRIIPQVLNTSATVSLQSKGMEWGQVRVTLWLSSRDDMFVGTIVGGTSLLIQIIFSLTRTVHST